MWYLLSVFDLRNVMGDYLWFRTTAMPSRRLSRLAATTTGGRPRSIMSGNCPPACSWWGQSVMGSCKGCASEGRRPYTPACPLCLRSYALLWAAATENKGYASEGLGPPGPAPRLHTHAFEVTCSHVLLGQSSKCCLLWLCTCGHVLVAVRVMGPSCST